MDGNRILVTGASGALGTRVVPALRAEGWVVRAMTRRTAAAGDEVVRADLTDRKSLRAATEGTVAILHLAAVTHSRNPAVYFQTNVGGTVSLLSAALQAGVRRFVHVSTRAISPAGGAYSRSKRDAEGEVERSGLDYTIVRLPELYGGGGREGVDHIIEAARSGRSIPLVGDGSDPVCPLHIDDTVGALVAALRPAAARRLYTLAGECVTLREFAETCIGEFGSASRIVAVPRPLAAMLSSAARFVPLPLYPDQLERLAAAKPPLSPEAKMDLDFRPRTLSEGLRAVVSAQR